MYLLLNWRRGNPYSNMMNMIMVLFLVLISLSVSALNPTVDNYGHLGGLIYGFFIFPLFVKPEDENDCACCTYRIWRIISISFSVIFYIGGFVLFFFVKSYPVVRY
jgi:hypothetical protein